MLVPAAGDALRSRPKSIRARYQKGTIADLIVWLCFLELIHDGTPVRAYYSMFLT
jgi:hypothetical protein